MTDPVADGARAAAERLAAEFGPGLAADVEAALYTRGQERRPERYLDPVSLGSLVVSIASLAWTVYTGLKQKTPSPPPDVVARSVRVELRNHGEAAASPGQVVDVVVTEVIKAVEDTS